MGTKDLTFVQLNQLIGRKTGGISVYPLTSSVRGKEDPCSHIIVRGKAMAGRTEDLFNLVYWFLFFTLYDNVLHLHTVDNFYWSKYSFWLAYSCFDCLSSLCLESSCTMRFSRCR